MLAPDDQIEPLDFATRCVHAGQEPDPTTGAVMMPIYATSTYVQQSPACTRATTMRAPEPDPHGVRALHRRSRRRQRAASPSPRAWRRSRPCSTASTTAPTSSRSTISTAARAGCSSACAGARRGSTSAIVDLTDAGALEAAIRPNTRLIWVETPTNPLLKLVDLERVADDRASSAAS